MKAEVNPKNSVYNITYRINGGKIDEISREEQFFSFHGLNLSKAIDALVKVINPAYTGYDIELLDPQEVKEKATHLVWIFEKYPLDTLFVQIIEIEEVPDELS